MDVLADVMQMARTGPAVSMRIDIRSPWALRSTGELGASFTVVLQGTCWLVREDGSPPLALGPGDVLLQPRGGRHVLADDPRTPPVQLPCLDGSVALDTTRFGGAGARTLLLGGGYQLDWDRPHPLLAALPDVIHVPADAGATPACAPRSPPSARRSAPTGPAPARSSPRSPTRSSHSSCAPGWRTAPSALPATGRTRSPTQV